jgi:hypothetical protein
MELGGLQSLQLKNRESSVGIATSSGLDKRGIGVRFPSACRPAVDLTQPHPVGSGGSFDEGKATGE